MIMAVLREEEKGSGGRNYGIDALRLLSMYMVTLLHTLGQGGVLSHCQALSANYCGAWLLETAAYCAVDCYALISGYVSGKKPPRPARFLELWLSVVAVSAVITLGFAIADPSSVTAQNWISAFTPVMNKEYWYFTAYAGMLVLSPYCGAAVYGMTVKEARVSLALLAVMFSVLPTVFGKDAFLTHSGYSCLWLFVLYAAGALLRRADVARCVPSGCWLAAYAFCILISWMVKIGILLLPEGCWIGEYVNAGCLISYTSPTIVLAGAALLLFFSGRSYEKRVRTRRLIMLLSPSAFGVYVIHVQPLIWTRLIKDYAAGIVRFEWYIMLPLAAFCAFALFAVCLALDMLRRGLFGTAKRAACAAARAVKELS